MTQPPQPPRLDDQLCFALHAASRALTKAYRPALNALGLTYTQYITLMVLWESTGLSVSELGSRLRMDSGTLTPLLKRLERDGLVRRQRCVNDERSVLIHLTKEGRALEQKAATIQHDMACTLSAKVEDLDGLKAQLEVLMVALDELGNA